MSKYLLIAIGLYQKISSHYPKNCRFSPTCSEYFRQAITKYGLIYGLFLGTKRIIRCNQFFKGGYDPLPCNH
ncbi:MAG: membrane protein insertion efficiency factor YidD [Candidatus Margulisiibacteriota bacterium]